MCREYKSGDQFPTRRAGRGMGSYCKPCQRGYSRRHYQVYKRRHNARRRRNQAAYRLRNQELLREYLLQHKCVDCGYDDIRVLEFDHVRGEKIAEVCVMVDRGYAWKKIEAEIAKCAVRCANCHRRKTVTERRWWRSFESAVGTSIPEVSLATDCYTKTAFGA